MIPVFVLAALPLWNAPEAPVLSGGGRAYFESAYCSSTGKFGYSRPIAEQYYDLTLSTADYGSVTFDCWAASALNDQQDAVHRRAFYCLEETLTYGYDFALDRDRKYVLSQNAGILWDWLYGYRVANRTPYCWYAFQSLKNPYLVPYWNALGGMINTAPWTRVRTGVKHDWQVCEAVSLTPYVDATWGDSRRFRSNYGTELRRRFLGGSVMYAMAGAVLRWRICGGWYVWGRYRHMFVVDSEARRALRERNGALDKQFYPMFGLGIGVRF